MIANFAISFFLSIVVSPVLNIKQPNWIYCGFIHQSKMLRRGLIHKWFWCCGSLFGVPFWLFLFYLKQHNLITMFTKAFIQIPKCYVSLAWPLHSHKIFINYRIYVQFGHNYRWMWRFNFLEHFVCIQCFESTVKTTISFNQLTVSFHDCPAL